MAARRKDPTFSVGTVTFTGIAGSSVPEGTGLQGSNIGFETVEEITIGDGPSECAVRALDPGAAGNLLPGTPISLTTALNGVGRWCNRRRTGGRHR